MKKLTFVCATAILIACFTTGVYARVIAGDLDNSVAVYYFTSLTNSGTVADYGRNRLDGFLENGAQLNSTASGWHYLSLPRNASIFGTAHDDAFLSVSKQFSIVAWVKIPSQRNDLEIAVDAYDPIDDVNIDFIGGVELNVKSNGNLRGEYFYNDYINSVSIQTTGRIVNNNMWHHIGFVINQTRMRLYLNGNRIASRFVSRHQSFNGAGTLINIDYDENAKGSVSDLGFFKDDFSDAQIKLIYDKGLGTIMSIASVDPGGGKVATTWGTLKKR